MSAKPQQVPTCAPPPAGVQTVAVTPDEAGMRVDRFLEARFPGLCSPISSASSAKASCASTASGRSRRIASRRGRRCAFPRCGSISRSRRGADSEADKTRAFLKSITLYEDADVLVLNKPMGLSVQGGSGTVRHVDGMLEVLRDAQGQRPRLVHRLDKDTAGCLLVAKTRFAATALTKSFRTRSTRKIYWALVAGVPKPRQGRISTFLAKEEVERDLFMRIAKPRRGGREPRDHLSTRWWRPRRVSSPGSRSSR